MAIALATLQTWLDDALSAKQKLMTGTLAVKVGSPDGSVEFTAASSDRLDAWIQQLQTWIAAGSVSSAGSARRPIYFTF